MSLGTNALRRHPPRLVTALCSRRFRWPPGSLLFTASFASQPALRATNAQQAADPVEKPPSTLARGSPEQLTRALQELDASEAELLATLDEYEQSAERDAASGNSDRLRAGVDDGYPLEGLSAVKPYRLYRTTGSALVAPFRRYPTRGETNASSQRHRKELYRHLWGEKHFFSGDWERTYRNLANFTPYPAQWHSRALEVYLTPEQAAKFRTQEPGNHLWEVGMRTGSVLELEPTQGSNGYSLILSGEESHLRKCLDEVVQLLGQVYAKKRLPDGRHVPPPPSQQYPNETLLKSRGYFFRISGQTVHEHPNPKHWTKESLEEYVAWLVTHEPNTRARASYARLGEEHQHSIVRKLLAVLWRGPDGAPTEVLTTPAFKLALGFMAQKGTIFCKQLWALFRVMSYLRVPYDADIFNILLENCAKSMNNIRFNQVLIMMHKSGFSPNLLSWQMFLRMVRAPQPKRGIIQDLKTRGLLRNPLDKANVASELVEHDLEHFIRSQKELANFQIHDFFLQQDAVYGDRKWLNLNVFKRIVGTLGRFSLFRDCFRSMIDVLREPRHQFKPTTAVFDIILTHISRQPSKYNKTFPKLAIKVIRALEEVRRSYESQTSGTRLSTQAYKPSERTYHILFHLGYRLRLPNFLAVVWRYAAMQDRTSNWMRLKVTRYLVFGRIGRSNDVPLVLRSYMRRLFMDEVMTRSLDQSLIKYYKLKRAQEVLQLAQLRDEPAIKHLEIPKAGQGDGNDGEADSIVATAGPSQPVPRKANLPPKAAGAEPEYLEAQRAEMDEENPSEAASQQKPEPPEAWQGKPDELSMLALWKSEVNPTRRFDYETWHRHGLAVAREYRDEFRDWTPKWPLSQALGYALGRDLQLRKIIDKWELKARAVRHGRHRNGMSHGEWLKHAKNRFPTPMRIPIYSHKLTHLPYQHRFRSFGGDSNDTLELSLRSRLRGPRRQKNSTETTSRAVRARNRMKAYVDEDEFARMFRDAKRVERKELGGWEKLLMEHGHDVG